jgi:hypothetical protein
MELSVIIVNWNTRNLLCKCLDSLNQVVKKIEMEIFVVDNGSVDGSGEAIRKRFPVVKLIENQTNLGFAKANNQALRLAKGKYTLLLNPDTQLKKGAIEEMISFMSAHPEVGVVGGQLLNSGGSKQNSIANFPSLATELLNKSLLRWLFPENFPGKETSYHGPIEVDSVIGACMMVRREAMEQVGLLDEDYFLFLEETDWCYRMKKASLKIYHIPQAEIFHLQGRSAEENKERARVEYYRSRYHFFRKNRGRFQWTILHIGLLIRLAVELIFASIISILTFFTIKQWRRKLSTYAYLVWWHLRFCPEGMGLKPVR